MLHNMSRRTFAELYTMLRTSDESALLEAKTSEDIGMSILETISAFSNEPGRQGGYLLLGVAPSADPILGEYEVRGVPNAEQVQANLASQCGTSFNIPIRPILHVEEYYGRTVIVAYVPEAAPHDKPVYIKSRGMHKGAFRRIGPTDHVCTDEDIQIFYQLRGDKSFDAHPIDDSSLDDIDIDALNEYRKLRQRRDPTGSDLELSDEELMYALAATTSKSSTTRLTYCGLLCFGKAASLRRLLPSMRVDYIRVPGREWVQDPEERFDAIEMRGPLLKLIPQALNIVLNDLPKTFSLSKEVPLFREEVPTIPTIAIREAIVNALMHRSYKKHQPIQIIRYANRLEIKNAGHSLVPDDQLGEPGSLARNEKIAAILHEVGLAETMGTGIRAIQRLMTNAGLSVPFFESDRVKDEFTATLLTHHLLSRSDVEWLSHFKAYSLSDDETKAMIVIREMGALTSADYRRLNGVDIITANRKLRKLSDFGFLEQKGRGAELYYKPTDRLLEPHLFKLEKPAPNEYEPISDISRSDLPLSLQELLDELPARPSYAETRRVILRLCAWRPLRSIDLATILKRSKEAIARDYLRPMMNSGDLELMFPARASHPRQAYRTTDANRSN